MPARFIERGLGLHRGFYDEAEISFPNEHRAKLDSINPIERLNGEVKRRNGVGIFPNDVAMVRADTGNHKPDER
ncbi:hypothetical protein A9K71_21500 [Mesorhizobium sp. WSM3873]|nr:hypothetical protein A9K71_21500 [Mesorhizobium sp. WSM3873]